VQNQRHMMMIIASKDNHMYICVGSSNGTLLYDKIRSG
jgi:hypothetical protein